MRAPQERPDERRTTPSPKQLPEASPEHHPRLAVIALCAAGIVVSVMQTIIVPLLPDLDRLLDTSKANATWTLTITLLCGAAVTPIIGRLGDMYGKRRMLLLNLGFVTAGSVVCALSSSLAPFLVGRALQGLGIGTVALGISVMRDIVPGPRLGPAVGAMSASLGIGGAIALPIAAGLAQYTNWHMLFWVCAVVAAAVGVGIAATVTESPVRSGGRFDFLGAVGLSTFLICLLLPLSKGAEWGWSSPPVLGLIVVAAIVGIGWVRYERRHDNALVDLEVTMSRPVMLTNIASVATGFAFYSMQLIPIQLLMAPTDTDHGLGMSMILAAAVLAPSGFVVFAFSHISARISTIYGPRISLAIGGGLLAAGYVVFIAALLLMNSMGWWMILIVACVNGAGIGTAYSAMPALIMRTVRVEQTGEANGVNALTRVVGTSLSAAVIGMILTAVGTSSPTDPPSTAGYLWASIISLSAGFVAAAVALAIPARADHEPVTEERV